MFIGVDKTPRQSMTKTLKSRFSDGKYFQMLVERKKLLRSEIVQGKNNSQQSVGRTRPLDLSEGQAENI